MSDDPKTLPVLPVHVVRLEAVLHGASVGLITGLTIFLATNWLVLKGGPVVGPHLSLLAQFLVGYEVSVLGSVIGFGWGFVYGFLAAYGVSTVYNRIVAHRARGG
jgi:hypothetical protein